MSADQITMLMGHPVEYWHELDRRFKANAESPRTGELIEEIIKLRAKVSFYEARISEMAGVLSR